MSFLAFICGFTLIIVVISDKIYTILDVFGCDKVDEKTLKPLSEYYTPYLKIRKNNVTNSEEVHKNVEILIKSKKI